MRNLISILSIANHGVKNTSVATDTSLVLVRVNRFVDLIAETVHAYTRTYATAMTDTVQMKLYVLTSSVCLYVLILVYTAHASHPKNAYAIMDTN